MSKESKSLCEQLKQQGIKSQAILKAINKIPREKFIQEELKEHAYVDTPLPIARGQTISQPYIVARMTELLTIHNPKKVLEIGTGSGYQAAILALLVEKVYTIERIGYLHMEAKQRLENLGFQNIDFLLADGQAGWPGYAPYDAIIITAALAEIPESLLDQLDDKGILVAPVYKGQNAMLVRIQKDEHELSIEEFEEVRFVPVLSGIE